MPRKPTLESMLRKRQIEDEKLRATLESLKADRAKLDTHIAEIERLLGAPQKALRSVSPTQLRCLDCNALVPTMDHVRCPACGAQPFEGGDASGTLSEVVQ